MGLVLLWGGVVVYLVGIVWLIYLAWSNDRPLMAVGIFCLGPIFGLIYTIQNFDEAKIPFGVMLVGFVMRIAGMVIGT